MIQLEKEFLGSGEVRGYNFKQVKANDYAYIYEVRILSGEDVGCAYYEVFERKVTKGGQIICDGETVNVEPKEVYPSCKAFGIWAWCVSGYDNALRHFEEITERLSTKK